jgi:hypothetical protein
MNGTRAGRLKGMDAPRSSDENQPRIWSCDGDLTIREGDWLRLWNSLGLSPAHDVWVGYRPDVYENSGPGGNVRKNPLANVLAGRKVIQIVSRTAPADLDAKVTFAEARLGTPWAAFYNCQDFASEVATGIAQSFQRDAILGIPLVFGLIGVFAWAFGDQPPKRKRSRRSRRTL